MLDTSKIPVERIEGYNNHITNCITKIPQDIKLELKDGTLTLKAGSKVYVPNGVGVFNEVIIQSDEVVNTASVDGKLFAYLNDDKYATSYTITQFSSGTTAPSSGFSIWFDTDAGKIKRYTGATFQDEGSSFPFAAITVSGGKVTSIDQVFNGFGYIGSTVFALPGVEGLVPNGFNEDGSLNNILCTINDVKIANTIAGWNNHWYLHLLNENSIAYHPYELYFNQTSSPISMGQTSYWYNPNENIIYYTEDFGITWNSNRKITPFLDIIQDREKIISITPKLVYQNNTKNDFNKKFQVVSELPTTPEVGVFYFVKE